MITFTKVFITKETPIPEGAVRALGQFGGAFIGAVLNLLIAGSCTGPSMGNPNIATALAAAAAAAGGDSRRLASGSWTLWVLLSTAGATAVFLLIFFKTQAIAKTDTEKALWFILALLAIPANFPTNP